MTRKVIFLLVLLPATLTLGTGVEKIWGFYGHKLITEMAIYTLPSDLIPFFKEHKGLLISKSVQPDQRRYVNPDEGPRHYIDLDLYENPDSIPRFWPNAVSKYGEDTLKARGIGPWYTYTSYRNLVQAMKSGEPEKIIRYAADLSHYIADSNVPLHTTSNYNGQFTGQTGIHGFWESRIPELFAKDFDFWVGQAEYVDAPLTEIWQNVYSANILVDSLFVLERELSQQYGDHRKYVYESRSKNMVRVASKSFSKTYLNSFPYLESQMRNSIKMIGDFWLTAWIEAGQPDLMQLGQPQASIEVEEMEYNEIEPKRTHEH